MALIANLSRRADPETLGAYATPNVIHLGAVLLVAAIVSAAWSTLLGPSIAVGLTGLAGLVHGAMVVGRARRQSGYEPVWEDWLWYTVSLLRLRRPCPGRHLSEDGHPNSILRHRRRGAGPLFVGIHNAWDAVTYIVTSGRRESMEE